MAAIPITNVTELQAIDGYAVDVSYYLANDIDASDTINWNGGLGFKPITLPVPFSAVLNFDGRGHIIKDLYINRPTSISVGLFARCNAAAIVADVFLENAYIRGKTYVGGLYGTGSGTITNCGIISGTVSQTGINYCGGLAGSNTGAISKSYSKATVIGELADTGTRRIGGLVGNNTGTVTDCFSLGSVTHVVNPSYISYGIGGLVGYNTGTVTRCYSTGAVIPVQGTNMACNGFVGDNTIGTILASYWDTENSGYTKGTEPSADPPTGKTTAQMKQEATFAGWDFCRTWQIIEGVSYPALRIGKKKRRARRST